MRCVFVFGVRPLPKLHELSAESWEGGGRVSGPMYLGHVSGPLPKLHELSAESWEGCGHVSGPCIWAKGPAGGLSVGAREVEGKSAESVNMDVNREAEERSGEKGVGSHRSEGGG